MVFAGYGKLGTISVTLASLESLWSRGYRIDAIVFIEGAAADEDGDGGDIRFGEGNAEALREYVAMRLRDRAPSVNSNDDKKKAWLLDDDSIICLPPLPPMPTRLDGWYENSQEAFTKLDRMLCSRWRNDFIE